MGDGVFCNNVNVIYWKEKRMTNLVGEWARRHPFRVPAFNLVPPMCRVSWQLHRILVVVKCALLSPMVVMVWVVAESVACSLASPDGDGVGYLLLS